MRQFRRHTFLVPTLKEDGAGGKTRSGQVQEFERTGALPSSFPSHWTLPDVRGALYAVQGRVCAYCGADIAEAGIDVEHFRPKSRVDGDNSHGGYWWLAYDFKNYLLSCTVCNQKYKRARFPLREGSQRVRYESRDTMPDEERVLLEPTLDLVEGLLSVEWQKPAGRLVPNPNLGSELTERVQQVLQFFRLNLNATHRRRRADIQRLVVEKVAENKADEVRHLAIRYRPHSLVAKQILEVLAPHALPTAEEELAWLLNELTSELIHKLEDLKNVADVSELDKNEAKELLWALAVLWKDPPAGRPDSVAEFLDRRSLKGIVAEYVSLL